MKTKLSILVALALTAAALPLRADVTKTNPNIDPAARAVVDAVTAKLAPARTIELTAKHKLDPALGTGGKLDRGPIQISVQRPNQIYVFQEAGEQTRELAFDGKTFCLLQPKVQLHGMESLKAASVEEFADKMDERFGFRPPVAELLASDVAAILFRGVESARLIGRENVGWTKCQRVQIAEKGLTTDLWVGVKDNLPRRMLLTFTDLPGQPKWDIRLSDWKLEAPIDAALFTKRPAEDSFQIQMLKSR